MKRQGDCEGSVGTIGLLLMLIGTMALGAGPSVAAGGLSEEQLKKTVSVLTADGTATEEQYQARLAAFLQCLQDRPASESTELINDWMECLNDPSILNTDSGAVVLAAGSGGGGSGGGPGPCQTQLANSMSNCQRNNDPNVCAQTASCQYAQCVRNRCFARLTAADLPPCSGRVPLPGSVSFGPVGIVPCGAATTSLEVPGTIVSIPGGLVGRFRIVVNFFNATPEPTEVTVSLPQSHGQMVFTGTTTDRLTFGCPTGSFSTVLEVDIPQAPLVPGGGFPACPSPSTLMFDAAVNADCDGNSLRAFEWGLFMFCLL